MHLQKKLFSWSLSSLMNSLEPSQIKYNKIVLIFASMETTVHITAVRIVFSHAQKHLAVHDKHHALIGVAQSLTVHREAILVVDAYFANNLINDAQ